MDFWKLNVAICKDHHSYMEETTDEIACHKPYSFIDWFS